MDLKVLFILATVGVLSCGVGNAAETSCDSCSDCTAKLDGSYEVVKLTTDIADYFGTCVEFGANNTEFDCQGHTINGASYYYGVYMSSKSHNTVRNCVITEFNAGILLSGSDHNTLENNTLTYNVMYGISVSSSDNNTVTRNTASYNSNKGITLFGSGNNLTANTLYSNGNHGIYMTLPSNNALNSNQICNNTQMDIYAYNPGSGNSGDNNTCDTTISWNDEGTTGCSYECPTTTTTTTSTSTTSSTTTSTSTSSTTSSTPTSTTTSSTSTTSTTISGGIELDLQVSNGLDDVKVWSPNFAADSEMAITGNVAGGNYEQAWRFSGVDIPQGSTISSAYVSVAYSTNQQGELISAIQAEDADDASRITSESDFYSRTLTSAKADWDDTNTWSLDAWYDSSDISSVIQEVVDRPGWTSGNAINIFWLGDTTTAGNFRGAYHYEGGAAYAPKLHIEYVSAGATTTTSSTTSTTTTSTTSTSTTQGECTLAGDYPPCGEVSLSEIIEYINLWAEGQAGLSEVINLINIWSGGSGTTSTTTSSTTTISSTTSSTITTSSSSTTTSTTSSTTVSTITTIDHTAASWTDSVIDTWSTSSCGWYADLAIDGNDAIHVVHYINAYSTYTDGIYYTVNSGGSWSERRLISASQTNPYTRIAVDSNGGVHIAYPVASGLNLRYAYKTAAELIFSSETVASSATNNLGQYTDMYIDEDDVVYISYLDRTDYKLFLASKPAGSASGWTIEEVYDGVSDADTSIVVANNVIHIAFVDSNGFLKYVYKPTDSGTWSEELVDTQGTMRYPSIALDSSGTPHIAYLWSNGGDGDDGALMFSSRIAAGAWSVSPEMIDDTLRSGEYASLAFDQNDNILIAYHRRALSATYLDSYLKVAVKDSGDTSWTTKTIDTGDNSDDEQAGTYAELAVDSTGKAHIVYRYESGGSLKYAVES